MWGNEAITKTVSGGYLGVTRKLYLIELDSNLKWYLAVLRGNKNSTLGVFRGNKKNISYRT